MNLTSPDDSATESEISRVSGKTNDQSQENQNFPEVSIICF